VNEGGGEPTRSSDGRKGGILGDLRHVASDEHATLFKLAQDAAVVMAGEGS
jgi:hypothetical protein